MSDKLPCRLCLAANDKTFLGILDMAPRPVDIFVMAYCTALCEGMVAAEGIANSMCEEHGLALRLSAQSTAQATVEAMVDVAKSAAQPGKTGTSN